MDEFTDSFLEENQEEIEVPFNFFGNPKEVLAKYTHCAVCDANLHFTHLTDFAKNQTQETARCLECSSVKPRLLTHKLH